MLRSNFLFACVVFFSSSSLLADPLPVDIRRQEAVTLLLSARDVFQGLTSYRCRVRWTPETEYKLAYSGAKYRIEVTSDEDHSVTDEGHMLRTFDGETFSLFGLNSLTLSTGTRSPSNAPMFESPFNVCYGFHDVTLDHYHGHTFLEKFQSYVIDATPSDYHGMPCLKMSCLYASGRNASVWISKEYYGFPVASEEYAKDGTILKRMEVRDYEIVDVDGRKLLFPVHIHIERNIPLDKFPEESRKQLESVQVTDCYVDRKTLEINPTIPLSDFQVDASVAKIIVNTDTGEILLDNGVVLGADLEPKVNSEILRGSPESSAQSKTSPLFLWIISLPAQAIFAAVAFYGYMRWRK